MVRRVAAFLRAERGAATLLTALCLVTLAASAAIGVDLGDIYMRTRQLQGVADLAAMSAVQSLDPAATSTPQATAAATAALNPWSGGIDAQTLTGRYQADPSVTADQRFSQTAAADANAVRVTLHAPVQLYFAGLLTGSSTVQVSRTATAARAQYAAFSIGSRLASLNGGVANALLSALAGGQVQLAVMDYQALATAHVDLLSYLAALRTRAGVQAGGFDKLLTASVAPAAALNALADTLTASGQIGAARAAASLAASAVAAPATPLSSLFDLGPYGGQDQGLQVAGAGLGVNALGLADALLAASNGSRQLQLSLGSAVPGVAALQLWLAIGQRPSNSPWLTVTDSGQVIVRTAQMRLYVSAQLAPGALASVTGGALVQLPIFVEAASAQARLAVINCAAADGAPALELSVSPSLGTLALAQADPSKLNAFDQPMALQPATLLGLPLLTATAYSNLQLGGGQASWQTVGFSQADIASSQVKTVATHDVAQATVASLIAGTSVQVKAAGLTLGTGALPQGLQALLATAAPGLDSLLDAVETISGARLGEADVWPDGLRCHGAALVA